MNIYTTAFRLSPETISVIKEGGSNAPQFREICKTVQANALIYGYKGGTTSHAYTIEEREKIYWQLEKISTVIDRCASCKGKPKDEDISVIANGITCLKQKDIQFIDEIFKITFFWQYERGAIMDTVEVKAALDLWDWWNFLVNLIQDDYSAYQNATV